jgi:hypothetical protein
MLEAIPRVAILSLIAATLAACAAVTPTPTLPPAIPSMARAAATDGPLLYVIDGKTHGVAVLTYPGGEPVGTLTGFIDPRGDCVDKAGDVWIVDIAASTITEFAHGGATPIAVLQDAGEFPGACAVNPRTGDLAVSNVAATSLEPGSISIYANARGTPSTYYDGNLEMADSIAYDDRGDLFVAGIQRQRKPFYYGELHSGAQALQEIHWPRAVIGAGIVWDGRYIAVVDAALGFNIPVYRMAGHRLVGTSELAGRCNLFQFVVDRNRLICANDGGRNVQIYAYPGGSSVAKIPDSNVRPIAAVVSRT